MGFREAVDQYLGEKDNSYEDGKRNAKKWAKGKDKAARTAEEKKRRDDYKKNTEEGDDDAAQYHKGFADALKETFGRL